MKSQRIQDILTVYKDRIIKQYNNENNRSILEIFLDVLINEVILFEIQPQNAYNLDTATGSQLDTIGIIVDVDRFYSQGKLDDDTYRMLIKLKIVVDNTDCSMNSIVNALYSFFQDDIIVFSENQMDIEYIIKEDLTLLGTVALEKDLLPRPAGVKLNYIIPIKDKILGTASYEQPILSDWFAGVGSYEDTSGGQMLGYEDFIIN